LDNTDPDQGYAVGLSTNTYNDVVSVVNANDLVLAAATNNVLTVGFGSLSTYRVADASDLATRTRTRLSPPPGTQMAQQRISESTWS